MSTNASRLERRVQQYLERLATSFLPPAHMGLPTMVAESYALGGAD